MFCEKGSPRKRLLKAQERKIVCDDEFIGHMSWEGVLFCELLTDD